MKIYLDSNFNCHTTNEDSAYREIETNSFDGKCRTFIEGYCYDDSNGCVAVYPWKPYSELDDAQTPYERQQLEDMAVELADAKAALAVLGVAEDA